MSTPLEVNVAIGNARLFSVPVEKMMKIPRKRDGTEAD
jgi:hypothetical protein